MIEYYRIPVDKQKVKSETLYISEEYELKDAMHNGKIFRAKRVEMKNCNINDETISVLWTTTKPFCFTHLNLSENFSFISDKAVDHLCQSLSGDHLVSLNLADNNISDKGLSMLSESVHMSSLNELVLYGNSEITSEGLVILGQSKYLKGLKNLDLHATSVSDEGINFFIKTPNASNMESLNLSMNWKRISDQFLVTLSESKYCKRLHRLSLEDCCVTSRGFEEYADSQNASCLEALILNNSMKEKNNLIDDRFLEYLSFAKYLRKLKVLELRNTEVSSKGMRSLAASLSAEFLDTLRLSYCTSIDDEVILSLKTIINYQSFKKVYLNNTAVSKESFEDLEREYPHLNIIF